MTETAKKEKKAAADREEMLVPISDATKDSIKVAVQRYGPLGFNEKRAMQLVRAEAATRCESIDVAELVGAQFA